jgi:hypothetical protein
VGDDYLGRICKRHQSSICHAGGTGLRPVRGEARNDGVTICASDAVARLSDAKHLGRRAVRAVLDRSRRSASGTFSICGDRTKEITMTLALTCR